MEYSFCQFRTSPLTGDQSVCQRDGLGTRIYLGPFILVVIGLRPNMDIVNEDLMKHLSNKILFFKAMIKKRGALDRYSRRYLFLA
ncbi:MAG: hypothetical protein VYA34_09265 [Myxococcota bacterium]|nr:hypothetical protein [Myxococcota bacterium]